MVVPAESNGRVNRHNTPVPSSLQFMDIAALAKRLGETHSHVQRLVSERRNSYCEVGRFIRFDPTEVTVWLEERRMETRFPAGEPVS
jgi:hypothetical protein